MVVHSTILYTGALFAVLACVEIGLFLVSSHINDQTLLCFDSIDTHPIPTSSLDLSMPDVIAVLTYYSGERINLHSATLQSVVSGWTHASSVHIVAARELI